MLNAKHGKYPRLLSTDYGGPSDGMENHSPPKFKPDPGLKLMD
jgi:hypothetical protein